MYCKEVQIVKLITNVNKAKNNDDKRNIDQFPSLQ